MPFCLLISGTRIPPITRSSFILAFRTAILHILAGCETDENLYIQILNIFSELQLLSREEPKEIEFPISKIYVLLNRLKNSFLVRGAGSDGCWYKLQFSDLYHIKYSYTFRRVPWSFRKTKCSFRYQIIEIRDSQ